MILGRHYAHPKCSPSRAALLTGRYAWTMGRQRGAIGEVRRDVSNVQCSLPERYQPTGLSTKYTLLPKYLKKAGYVTRHVS